MYVYIYIYIYTHYKIHIFKYLCDLYILARAVGKLSEKGSPVGFLVPLGAARWRSRSGGPRRARTGSRPRSRAWAGPVRVGSSLRLVSRLVSCLSLGRRPREARVGPRALPWGGGRDRGAAYAILDYGILYYMM